MTLLHRAVADLSATESTRDFLQQQLHACQQELQDAKDAARRHEAAFSEEHR
jgi:hypothetical protein